MESAPSSECDYDELLFQVTQECRRVLTEAVSGSHTIYKKGEWFYRIGTTKVGFYHSGGNSTYFAVYYGGDSSKDEVSIPDPKSKELASLLYRDIAASSEKLAREQECKKLEKLLRS